MKILHISPSYYPAIRYGGPIHSVHSLNKALAKKGIKVDVLTTNAGIEDGRDIERNTWTELDGIKVKYLNYYGYEHYTFSPGLFLELLKIARNYDLIHITAVWNFPVFAGSITAFLFGKPFIISTRGAINEEAFKLRSKNKKSIYWKLIVKQYFRFSSIIHFTTDDERLRFKQFADSFLQDEKLKVIPNGIDLTEYLKLPEKNSFNQKYTKLKNNRYVLFMGRINKIKGLDLLVEAFRKLNKDCPDLYLVIAGPDNDDYSKEIEHKLDEYAIRKRVIFTGMLEGDEKLAAFTGAELFVLPSYSENFGMAVVEAMACCTPVVVSDKVGIYREIEKENAGIVVETDPESLYSGIKNLLDDPVLKNEVSTNGRKLVNNFYDINKVADMMIETYKEVL